jgi:hypothetical protein
VGRPRRGGLAIATFIGASVAAGHSGALADSPGEPTSLARADALVAIGEEAARAGDHQKAYASFAAAYVIDGAAKTHLSMARALAALGDAPRAYEAASLTEREASSEDPATAEGARALKGALLQRVALVRIRRGEGWASEVRFMTGEITLPVGRAYALWPGKHVLRVLTRGGPAEPEDEAYSVKLTLVAGKARVVELGPDPSKIVREPTPHEEGPKASSPVAEVHWGEPEGPSTASAFLIGTGGVFGGLALLGLGAAAGCGGTEEDTCLGWTLGGAAGASVLALAFMMPGLALSKGDGLARSALRVEATPLLGGAAVSLGFGF